MDSVKQNTCKLEYPPLYSLSSKASGRNQKVYKGLTKAILICLVSASLFDVLLNYCSLVIYLTCLATAASVVLWLIADKGSSYEFWFDARALTESIKTASWRFAMCAEPYGSNLSLNEANLLFLKEIEEMMKQEKKVFDRFDYSQLSTCASESTESMIMIRGFSWEEKKKLYLTQRVIDQKNWYSSKAKDNEKSKERLGIIVVVLQITAIILAIIAAFGYIPSFAGAVLTLISSLLAWSQVQQRSLLSHSYGVAAKELALIEGKFKWINNAQELSSMVEQAELAMSREHTLWVSRNSY